MGSVEQHLGNETSTTLSHQLRDLWRSPRGTVLRIEALALVAITLSFFLAAFGSCRRWSSRWIIQKGFMAAQVLSLSLGTYSIGLMQSSSVKSEMYPIWAVSLLTLFGCVDPLTTYVGLDYKGPLLKIIFQLCLYCGYVLLMSASTISSYVGNLAIIMLCAITFFKGFHRSLALVLPSKTRDLLGELCHPVEAGALAGDVDGLRHLDVHLRVHYVKRDWESTTYGVDATSMDDIQSLCSCMGELTRLEVTPNGMTVEDVCLSSSLSYLLQRRFLRLDTPAEMEEKTEKLENLLRSGRAIIDYKRTLKVIEVELAFVYDVFFTSNEFLYFYEAKTSSFWALVSFLGISFVGVAIAIPGTMSSIHVVTSAAESTVVLAGTTRADLIFTLVIFVSLALLQLMQLIRCWTSSWVGVALASKYHRYQRDDIRPLINWLWWWVRTRAFVVTRISWFDGGYLWQDQLGQYTLVPAASRWRECLPRLRRLVPEALVIILSKMYNRLPGMLGLQYIGLVLRELLTSDAKGGAAARLDDDLKASIIDFLGQMMKSTSKSMVMDYWSSLFINNGLLDASCSYLLPYTFTVTSQQDYPFARRVMVWHIATSYCELAEQQQGGRGAGGGGERGEKNRRVAIALSKYFVYLVVSAPELLPGPSTETKFVLDIAAARARHALSGRRNVLAAMQHEWATPKIRGEVRESDVLFMGVDWGKRLLLDGDPWEVLARLWVQTLLYAAPYGDTQAHMKHLSQGGEFITHVWALLYHLGIDRWEHQETKKKQEEEEETVEQTGESSNITQEDQSV